MHEIVVISGKGGTGKTSLTAAFAHLASNKVICDLDVDAPDLHLLLRPKHERVEEFYSGHEAHIDRARCVLCGVCDEMCRFDAIGRTGDAFLVDGRKCEGCKVCVHFCPEGAIDFERKHAGRWYVSETRFGPLVHAQLFPGEENSGRLVSVLRQLAREMAEAQGSQLILSDGSPGIGCPVISSLSNTDLAVIVTEPTPSGRHDLERVVELCERCRIPVGIIVNKHDLNTGETRGIARYCLQKGLELVARIPHDPAMTQAMVAGVSITEYDSAGLGRTIDQAWREIVALAEVRQAA